MFLIPFLMFFAAPVHAQEKSAFEQALDQDSGVKSEESWVVIKGTRYRKIDLRGERYYMLQKGSEMDAVVYCQPPKGSESERVIEESVATYHRTQGFLQAFRASCKAEHGGVTASIHLGPEMGLKLSDEEGAAIKNKKIILNPARPLSGTLRGDQ